MPSPRLIGGGDCHCMDGPSAGYFIWQGRDPSLFVINLDGGGCSDETNATNTDASCTANVWKYICSHNKTSTN